VLGFDRVAVMMNLERFRNSEQGGKRTQKRRNNGARDDDWQCDALWNLVFHLSSVWRLRGDVKGERDLRAAGGSPAPL